MYCWAWREEEVEFKSLCGLLAVLMLLIGVIMAATVVAKPIEPHPGIDWGYQANWGIKLVWENARKLSESGLIEKSDNGKYRCSRFGEASFIMLSLVLKHLQEMFESFEGR